MRYKRLIAIALCIISFCISSVYASDSMVTSAYMLEGNLYYCNSSTGQVVLKNVKPLMSDSSAADLARKIEYTETRLFDKNLFLADNTQIEYDWLNNYADDAVRFIAIEQADGSISILHLKFK